MRQATARTWFLRGAIVTTIYAAEVVLGLPALRPMLFFGAVTIILYILSVRPSE